MAAPLTASESLETYSINNDVLRASILKIVNDCKLDPKDYKVYSFHHSQIILLQMCIKRLPITLIKALVSISQNIPSVLIEDIMKILLEDIHFQVGLTSR